MLVLSVRESDEVWFKSVQDTIEILEDAMV